MSEWDGLSLVEVQNTDADRGTRNLFSQCMHKSNTLAEGQKKSTKVSNEL